MERVAEGSSPEERDLLQWFKAAQLRARDGENDEADWVKMQEVMDLGTGSLPTDPNVTCLMPTREARSVHNNEQLEIAWWCWSLQLPSGPVVQASPSHPAA